MGYAPRHDFRGQPPAEFQPPVIGQTHPDQPPPVIGQTPPDPPPVIGQTPPDPVTPRTPPDQPPPIIGQTPPDQPPPVIGQTPPDPVTPQTPQPIGVAAVTISPPASVLNLGDALDVSVSLTEPATADTTLYPIFYQVLVGRYSPIDPSVFLFAPIKVAAGSTTAGFQTKYQNVSSPGTYIVSVVTADEASLVADITQLPVTNFASFIIQGDVSGASTQSTGGQTSTSGLGLTRQDITVGDLPVSLVVDGTNIWIIGQGSVSAVSAVDGRRQFGPIPMEATAAASVPVGAGTVMWVTGLLYNMGFFNQLSAIDGSILRTQDVVQQPAALAAIQHPELGSVIYFTDLNSDALSVFFPDTLAVLTIGHTGIVGATVLLFDGTNFWICNGINNTVSKVDKNSGGAVSFPVGNGPSGLAFDRSSIWVANFNDNTISKLSVNDGQILQTIATGLNPGGIAFDSANLWVTNWGSNTLTQIRASDGVVLGNFATGLNPAGVVFDGVAHIWVANYGSGTISKYWPRT